MASIVDELKSASISTNEKIDRAIKKINASAQFAIVDNSVDQITWADGTSPISKSDISTSKDCGIFIGRHSISNSFKP